jgi:HD-like signal output (HDOD) protein
MQSNKIATLLAGVDTIPTLPAIVGQVTKAIANPESSARDLMEIIQPDQALTLKILRIANSAFYGRVREVCTLEQAIMVLGFNEIRNLVISVALFNNFHKLKATPLFVPGKFWEHSFLCGLAARIIAKKIALSGSELFLAGLMHDIGKLAICMLLPEEFSNIVATTGNGSLKTYYPELQTLGTAHDEVGASLFKRWLLPTQLVTAAAYHHRPERAPAQTTYPMIVHLADVLAHHATAMEKPDDNRTRSDLFPQRIVHAAQSRGIIVDQEAVDKFAGELEAQMEAQAGILEIFLS